jgi:hypothetical protein
VADSAFRVRFSVSHEECSVDVLFGHTDYSRHPSNYIESVLGFLCGTVTYAKSLLAQILPETTDQKYNIVDSFLETNVSLIHIEAQRENILDMPERNFFYTTRIVSTKSLEAAENYSQFRRVYDILITSYVLTQQ